MGGEGWHNWHHKYPFDYAASEFGVSSQFNPSKLFIDMLASVGLVWGRKRGLLHGIWDAHEETEIVRLEFLFPSLCQGPGSCLLLRLFRPNKIEVFFSQGGN